MAKHGGPAKLAYNIFSANTGNGPMFGAEIGNDAIWGMHQVMRPYSARSGLPLGTTWLFRWDIAALQLFVDGALRDEETAVGAPRQGNTEPLLIGAESYKEKIKSGFRGQIDHAALWDRALSDAEIASLSGVDTLADKRPTYYGEKYRPQFHFTGARSTGSTIPTRLFFYEGVWAHVLSALADGADARLQGLGLCTEHGSCALEAACQRHHSAQSLGRLLVGFGRRRCGQ